MNFKASCILSATVHEVRNCYYYLFSRVGWGGGNNYNRKPSIKSHTSSNFCMFPLICLFFKNFGGTVTTKKA